MSGITERIAAALVTLTLGAGTTAWAQDAGHTHKSPHGGDIVEVANHHVEFKADSTGTIAVWLLDEQQKTLPPPAKARVTLIDATGGQTIHLLEPDPAAQRLVARFDPKKLTSFQAVVSMPIEGARHNLRFRYPSHH